MARTRLFDVPRDERRPAGTGRALRLHQQPQFRGAPGCRRPHAPRESRHGRGSGGPRAFCRRPPVRMRERTMKKTAALLALFFAVALTGCNTMKGFGQDLQKVGDKIEEKAKK